MITELVDAVLAGAVRAWFVMGEDPLTSEPNLSHARHALEQLDLLVCQDIFLNTTGQMADVILPSVSFAEKDGTFTNSDRQSNGARRGAGGLCQRAEPKPGGGGCRPVKSGRRCAA
jgi:predicted molibdopterin-dependent oxidoreductase YjgC